MVDITAIFLAAGRGVRMGERGRMTPKGLLSIGPASFVEDAVATLRAHGLSSIRIVTGHLADHYKTLARERLPDAELRHNPDFADKGSLHSLLVGLKGEAGPCLLLESDLVFEPRAVEAVIADPARASLLVSGPTGAGDEVYVWADDRAGKACLKDMSKDAARWPTPHHGELVGLTYLTADAVTRLNTIGPGMVAQDPMSDYESGIVALAGTEPVICPKIDDLAWAEVDNETMLARAAELVYPRIAAARKTHPLMGT
ncbi:phosphocholine cytidylyltransferase family protein [Stappia sp. ES.058]|uniref:phosphocholine cytidylyltransferase family protein n=1 Tax=Stappia sp. ES.058 TaxID=1881061 RepID=UPI00087A7464|nr:phosphocholine cytidylyltransferase family protein [Stappia sp. ES.058]SDU33719.1 Choline kinase [Stappia sp. ES.058]